jgi:ethanolamine ammonia-lyase small subunit
MSGKDIDAGSIWTRLRALTPARVGLGHAGVSQPTAAHLVFQRDHALARDAVWRPLDLAATWTALSKLGFGEVVAAASAAPDRAAYLGRPDLGRRLDATSCQRLAAIGAALPERPDVVFTVVDGLSSLAVERNASPLLEALSAPLAAEGWGVGPLVLATQGRVALGDEIGALLGARLVVVLIGERPGLSSPDSLGVYLTYDPCVGRMDAERNCLSNVRGAGMSPQEAARRLLWLMREARRRGLSGVALKDESGAAQALPEG